MLTKTQLMNKAIILVMVLIALASSGVLFYFLALRMGDLARENQTYNRFISCVLSVPALDRDQAKIDHCWITVQQDTGIQVKRYDK